MRHSTLISYLIFLLFHATFPEASTVCFFHQIAVMDETWTVFRRYSRFREMHKSLKLKYPEVSNFYICVPCCLLRHLVGESWLWLLCESSCDVSLFQLAALEFPPKKLFGNRDERMVAERRNHLEVRHLNKYKKDKS